MLLATYQSKMVREEKRNTLYDCFRDKLGGDYPIFCIPTRTEDEFAFRSVTAEMHFPELLLFFETEDFVKFDFIKWNNIKDLPRDDVFAEKFEDIFRDVQDAYAEYAIGASRLGELSYGFDIAALLADPSKTGNMSFSILQDQANEVVHDSMKENLPEEEQAKIRQDAYVRYIGWSAWGHAAGNPVSPFSMVPFAPGKNPSSVNAWQRYMGIYQGLYEPSHIWSYDEWERMRDEVEKAVGINRLCHIKSVNRSALCPCGSGKKFKNCHWLRPVRTNPES